MAAYSGPHVIKQGLILQLDAQNPDSYSGTGTVWKDVSGNGNDATLVNAPLHEDGLFKFDGINEYADTNYVWSNLYLGGSFMVFGFSSTGTAITQGVHKSKRFYWDIGTNGVYHGVQNKFANGAAHGIGTAQPFSVASTYSGSTTANFFVNATKIQTMTGISNDPAYSPDVSWRIAAGMDGSGNINGYRNIQVGLVLFYDRELTEDEVKQNHEAFRGRYGV